MRWKRPAKHRQGRALGVTLVILSLVHTPLPEADFHNIRHHDAPGEVCEHHDHLLRWHPDAGAARDVSVLHWHWFLPGTEGTDASSEGTPGAALHAHAPGWLTGVWDHHGPAVAPAVASRPLDRPALCLLAPPPTAAPAAQSARGPHPPFDRGTTRARRVSLTALLHRWVC